MFFDIFRAIFTGLPASPMTAKFVHHNVSEPSSPLNGQPMQEPPKVYSLRHLWMVSRLFLGVNWSPMLLTRAVCWLHRMAKESENWIGQLTPLLMHKKTWKKHVNTHNKSVFVRTNFAYYFHFIQTTTQLIDWLTLNPSQPQQQAHNNLWQKWVAPKNHLKVKKKRLLFCTPYSSISPHLFKCLFLRYLGQRDSHQMWNQTTQAFRNEFNKEQAHSSLRGTKVWTKF